jgi:hypothetical protein
MLTEEEAAIILDIVSGGTAFFQIVRAIQIGDHHLEGYARKFDQETGDFTFTITRIVS